MPSLTLSKSDQHGLVILRGMTDDAFQSLLLGIEQSPEQIPDVKSLSSADAGSIMDAIRSLYQIRAYADVSLEVFISDICDSLQEEGVLTIESTGKIADRLQKVLDVEALKIAARGLTLLSEHERLFCRARIVTDARPIYGKDISGPPNAMVITHILKMDYHVAGGRLDEIYVGLRSDDIKKLRNALDRAEEKARSLQSAFKAANIPFIDPEPA